MRWYLGLAVVKAPRRVERVDAGPVLGVTEVDGLGDLDHPHAVAIVTD